MLFCSCRHQSLLAVIVFDWLHFVSQHSDFWQLQLGLAVVSLQHLLTLTGESLVVEWLDLSSSDSGLVSVPDSHLLRNQFSLSQSGSFSLHLAVKKLHGLFAVVLWIGIDLHDLVTSDSADNPWSS